MNYDTEIQIHKNAVGSKTKLQESLLEAVQILHDGFIVNEKIPKTLECRIADDSKKDNGIYIVDYMNNKFEVNCFLDETFNVNDIVCVLVPDGDFAKTKIIIGSSDGSGEAGDQATKTELNEAVTTLQENFQDGVDAIGAACTRKGSPPASHSLEDTIAAIDAIQTGGNYATLEVREDGEYIAAEDPRGIDAYDIVVVSKDVGQPHTVIFYDIDGTTVLQTVTNVPYHGYASCNLLDGKIINNQYFKGWNPLPTNIVRDTLCYPQFGDYIIDPGDIEDDQETICATRGANYPLGSKKTLAINIYYDDYYNEYHEQDGVTGTYKKIRLSDPYPVIDNGIIYLQQADNQTPHTFIGQFIGQMVKVAEGEDGTISTWISTEPFHLEPSGCYWTITNDITQFVGGWANADYPVSLFSFGSPIATDYSDSGIRYILEVFLERNLPNCIRDTIKPVNKTYKGVSSYVYMRDKPGYDKTITTKIWALSRKELHTFINANYNIVIPSGTELINYSEEFTGIDYSTIYTPDYTAYPRVYLRSMVGWNNDNLNRATNYLGALRTDGMYILDESAVNIGSSSLNIPFGFCL